MAWYRSRANAIVIKMEEHMNILRKGYKMLTKKWMCSNIGVHWRCLNTSLISQARYRLSKTAKLNNKRLKKLLRIDEVDSTHRAIEFKTMPTMPIGRLPQTCIHQAKLLRNSLCSGGSSMSSQVLFVSLIII